MPEILILLSSLSPIPSIWSGRKLRGLLWWYSWMCLACDVAGNIRELRKLPRVHSNVFFLLEFVLIASHLLLATIKYQPYKKGAFIAVTLIACLFVLHAVMINPVKPDYLDAAVLYGLYMVMCIFALYRVLQEIEHVKIERSALFIFSSSFLLYASGSLIMLLFKMNLAADKPDLMGHIWDARNVLNIIKNLAIAYMFTLPKTKVPLVT